MRAELLIGLEGMIADLGDVYAAALEYAELASRADDELLPAIERLGAQLRHMIRNTTLTDDEVARAATEVRNLHESWIASLEALLSSSTYVEATEALDAGDTPTLLRLIPALFAGVTSASPTSLYVAVSVTTGRRKPGVSPFRAVEECAQQLADLAGAGLPADDGDERLPYVSAVADPLLLAGPVGLKLDAHALSEPIFQNRAQPFYRIYARRLRVPFTVVVADRADDDWWQTHDVDYPTFRDQLVAKLIERNIAVRTVASSAV